MNARLAARLTGWKIDITSDSEFAQQEADAAFGGGEPGDENDISGRCAAVLSNGKRCPNAALPGSKYCGVPAHQELALHEPRRRGQPDRRRVGARARGARRHRRARSRHRGRGGVRRSRARGVPGRPGRRSGRRRGPDPRHRRRHAHHRHVEDDPNGGSRSSPRRRSRGGRVAARPGPHLRRLRPQGAPGRAAALPRGSRRARPGRRSGPGRLHLPAPAVLRARSVAAGVQPDAPADRPRRPDLHVSTLDHGQRQAE